MKNKLIIAILLTSLVPHIANAAAATKESGSGRRGGRRMGPRKKQVFDPALLTSEQGAIYNALSPECKEAFKNGFNARREMWKSRQKMRHGKRNKR